MKLKDPHSYTNEPGILALEPGDPPLDEIKRVFKTKGLEIVQKEEFPGVLFVTIDYSMKFSQALLLLTISKPTYISYKSYEAMQELRQG